MSDFRFYIKIFGGGLGCIVLGAIFLMVPDVEWWRAVAAFLLGAIFIAIGIGYSMKKDDSSS